MKTILTILCGFIAATCYADQNEQLWQLHTDKRIEVPGKRNIIPLEYQLYKLDKQGFKLMQALIPGSVMDQKLFISLPTPDGGFMQFSVFEKPMMEENLALKYPQIKTYSAIAVSDARITAKLDFTAWGFHAIILNGQQTYYIDPYSDLTDEWYVVYYKRNFSKSIAYHMTCDVEDEMEDISAQQQISLTNGMPPMSYKMSGDTIRNYRLALACTEEYSAAVGGITPTKASVLSAMVTSINRVNGVFEKEFSMHATLVANNDTLIYLPGSGDPYTNGTGSAMLGENQSNITSRI